MIEDKTVFFEKRMYDPGFCKIVKYCYICGSRIKDGDAEEQS